MSPVPMCFLEGTKILCLQGSEKYIPVEQLKTGDLVKTLNGYSPIYKIGKKQILSKKERTKENLFVCSQETFSVFEDLVITGCHSILEDKLTDLQKENMKKELGQLYITQGKYRLMAYVDERTKLYKEGEYTIWHFALDHYDDYMNYGIYANGLLVESCSKRMMLRSDMI